MEAYISFLGYGIQPPLRLGGQHLNGAQQYLGPRLGWRSIRARQSPSPSRVSILSEMVCVTRLMCEATTADKLCPSQLGSKQRMKAELMKEYKIAEKDTPYWLGAAPVRPLPKQSLAKNLDFLIVGAGYTGLSAGLTLARAGRSVAALTQ